MNCQNPLTKDLYFYNFNVKLMSERTAVIRVPCMVRDRCQNPVGDLEYTLTGTLIAIIMMFY